MMNTMRMKMSAGLTLLTSSMCKHFRPVPQGCNLPNYKVCTDENDLWEPEPIIYKN